MHSNPTRKTIGVFFGSRSAEHDVSIITAQLIMAGLRALGYAVAPVYLTKQGTWLLGEELGELNWFTAPGRTASRDKKYQRYSLDLEASQGKLVFREKGWRTKTVVIDLAFPAFHGTFGEDGTIQGLFELFGVPYVGCGVPASAVAMDKALTKQLCQANNIPTTPFVSFSRRAWETNKAAILARVQSELRWPVFIKPVHLGSSIGITKVTERDGNDLEFRIEVALHYDDTVLAEEAVENVMDVTCCVVGNDALRASVLQESTFSADLLDFETKYLEGGGTQLGKSRSRVVIPARVDEGTTREIQEMAKRVYRAIGCSGIARVDFLYDQTSKRLYANEVNPLPGTLYHHLWKASGLELPELLEELIKLAVERQTARERLTYAFASDILRQPAAAKLKPDEPQTHERRAEN
ncbi:D-alanine--D-alanine ligase [Candidatus Parcubacteria bacterium]|nr:D-alanine--D-alanine ligase [Candidatus Parcubacteria bacterium]